MKAFRLTSLILLAAATGALNAQVPPLINYQGRVAVNGNNFEGAGQFKFALVSADGAQTFWSNDGTSQFGSEPLAGVTLTVTNGLYSVLLGDTALANMMPLTPGVFTSPDVRLRVWFNDGPNNWQLLSPDQRLAPTAYLADGIVTSSVLANGAVTSANIAPGAVTNTHIAQNSLGFDRLNVPAPTGPGQVLGYDGQSFVWTAPSGGGASPWSVMGPTVYYTGGRVGVGTASPSHQLSVAGGPNWTFNGWKGAVELENSAAIAWKANQVGNRFGMGHTGNGFYMFRTLSDPGTTGSSAVYDFIINDEGRVGIGTETPDPNYKLDVNGRVRATGAIFTDRSLQVDAQMSDATAILIFVTNNDRTILQISDNPTLLALSGEAYKYFSSSWQVISDARLKEDIRDFEAGLDQVLRLRPVRFRYREDAVPGATRNESVGFIAQEVQEVIPEAIGKGADGYLTVSADPIHWASVNAIKELNQKLEEQRAENAELKQRLERLEALVAPLNQGR